MKKFKYIVSWGLVLVWLVVIFNLSAQPASQSKQLSGSVTETIDQSVQKVTGDSGIRISESVVRENAHFFVYWVLAVLVMNALTVSEWKGRVVFALAICVLYAVTDEVHQLFVSGRGTEFKDLGIDMLGSALGVVIYLIGLQVIPNNIRFLSLKLLRLSNNYRKIQCKLTMKK